MIIVLKDTQTIMQSLAESQKNLQRVDMIVDEEIAIEISDDAYFVLTFFEDQELVLLRKEVGDDCEYRLMYSPLNDKFTREEFPIQEMLIEDGFADEFTIVEEDDTNVKFLAKHSMIVGTSEDKEEIYIREYNTEDDEENPELLILEDDDDDIMILQGCGVVENVDFEVFE